MKAINKINMSIPTTYSEKCPIKNNSSAFHVTFHYHSLLFVSITPEIMFILDFVYHSQAFLHSSSIRLSPYQHIVNVCMFLNFM